MADFERKLTMLAERGNRVGVEDMIERVEAQLAEDPLVVVSKQRKGWKMSVKTDDKTNRRPTGPPRWTWAVVAFVAVIAIGGLYVALNDEDTGDAASPAPTTTAPVTQTTAPEAVPTTAAEVTSTTSGEDRFAARLAVIEAMVAARNSGDYQAWRAFFPEERPYIFGGNIENEAELEWQQSHMAAGDVWTITSECTETFSLAIHCPMTLVNGFYGPAGIFFTVPDMIFRFNADDGLESITTNSWDIAGDPEEYANAFDAWLADAHPDVHASFGPRVEGEGALPNPDDMPVALEYVDEFIAQSDVYPVDG